MYHERQVGGWCRLHALNAALGGPCYTQASLREASEAYGRLMDYGAAWEPSGDILLDHGTHGGAFRFECFAFELATERNFFCVHVPGPLIGDVFGALPRGHASPSLWMQDLIGRGLMHPALMVYKPGHIFCVRLRSGVWHVVDSMNIASHCTTPRVIDLFERRHGYGMIMSFRSEGARTAVLPLMRKCLYNMLVPLGFLREERVLEIMHEPSAVSFGEIEFPLLCALRWIVDHKPVSEKVRHGYTSILFSFGKVTNDPDLTRTVLLPLILYIIEGKFLQ